jgi:hypothetical protein
MRSRKSSHQSGPKLHGWSFFTDAALETFRTGQVPFFELRFLKRQAEIQADERLDPEQMKVTL